MFLSHVTQSDTLIISKSWIIGEHEAGTEQPFQSQMWEYNICPRTESSK